MINYEEDEPDEDLTPREAQLRLEALAEWQAVRLPASTKPEDVPRIAEMMAVYGD